MVSLASFPLLLLFYDSTQQETNLIKMSVLDSLEYNIQI